MSGGVDQLDLLFGSTPRTVEDQVLRLALSTEAAGLDGIVCSAADMHVLKGRLNPSFLFVTPGIKGTSTPAGADQKRVLSPGRAVAAGSSLLVVGRALPRGTQDKSRECAGS